MGRMIRLAALALVIAAVFGGIVGGVREASAYNGYEQWVDDGSGCISYWDGYAYTASGCMRTDGGFDFYVASYGQWVYIFTTVPSSDGGLWIYYDGIWYFDSPSYDTSGLYPTTATIGAPTYSNLTGNVLVDQMLINSNNAMIDSILEPYCVEIVGNICYY